MRIAIYARRSTEEHQEESLLLQVANAKKYVSSRLRTKLGVPCTVADEHVFEDDAVSRAEFKKRPALLSMLNAAKDGQFDAVVMRDETRLGGDMLRTGLVMQELVDNGVRIFYFITDEEVDFDGATARFMVAAKNFAAELEREKTASRTRESLVSKAQRGLNAGGRCYGYDNVKTPNGVEYRVNAEQAEVVCEIFELYAKGHGNKAIAKELNSRGVPSPTAGDRGTGSWSPSCIREMLRRERYRGIVVWGRKGKEYRGGTRVRVDRPECDWVTIEAPELKIVSDELLAAVDQRIAKSRKFTGKAGAAGPRAKYLLSGLAKCGECGGSIQGVNCGGKSRRKVYVCSWHRDRGKEVCGNKSRREVGTVDEAVIGWIRENILTEELVIQTIDTLRKRVAQRAENPGLEVPRLKKEKLKLEREVERLTLALASSDANPVSVVKAIAAKEGRIAEIRGSLEAIAQSPRVIENDLRALEEQARSRLGDLRALMTRNPSEARSILEELLTEPLRFTPRAGTKQITVEGLVNHKTLFSTVGDPTGT